MRSRWEGCVLLQPASPPPMVSMNVFRQSLLPERYGAYRLAVPIAY